MGVIGIILLLTGISRRAAFSVVEKNFMI